MRRRQLLPRQPRRGPSQGGHAICTPVTRGAAAAAYPQAEAGAAVAAPAELAAGRMGGEGEGGRCGIIPR